MSTLPWFRLYREIIDDPKTGTLKDSEFRLFIEILCVISEKNDGISQKFLSWRLRRRTERPLRELIKRGLIVENVNENGDSILVVNGWEKRQFTSDSSTERTKRYRERLKKCDGNETSHVTSQERHSDAIDTDTDTDTDTETDTETDTDKKSKKKSSPSAPQILEVFEFWKSTMGSERSVLDEKRKTKIKNALKMGFSIEDLKKAITGNKNDKWHAENEVHELKYILKDSANIERFLGIVEKGKNDVLKNAGYVDLNLGF